MTTPYQALQAQLQATPKTWLVTGVAGFIGSNLLETLLAGSGRPLSRSYLLDTVWGSQRYHDTRTLDAHVYRLRNKLALRAETALRLTPVYGYGYQLDILDSF